MFNIDTYNQPAVELGKEATFALKGKTGPSELKKKCNMPDMPYEEFAKKIKEKTKINKERLV